MKKLILLTAALAASAKITEKKAYAWFGKTHRDILENALLLLAAYDDKYYDFFIDYKNTLLKACTEPDRTGDTDKGSGMHYYCAADKRGRELRAVNGYYKNRLRKFNRSARTMLEENYTMALSLYKSGSKEAAMHMLGRAIHFMQDIGCPVHSSGIRYGIRKTNPHYAFEKYSNGRTYPASGAMLDKRVKKHFESGLESAVNSLSRLSSSYAKDVRNISDEVFDGIYNKTIPASQNYTAYFMIRFFNDCMSDNGSYLMNDKEYTFKNLYTSGLLTAGERGVYLDAVNGEKEQRLRVILNPDGSFMLKAYNKGYIAKGFRGYLDKPTSNKPISFRAAAIDKRRFRITTEASRFKKVLTADKNGALRIKRFDPTDKGAVWVIKQVTGNR